MRDRLAMLATAGAMAVLVSAYANAPFAAVVFDLVDGAGMMVLMALANLDDADAVSRCLGASE